ncbi:MAG: hypothetical protein CMM94_04740 [Rickettsiales bacterium]|nr:hypothetical protein [Rickettsiales bacterium]
MNQPIENTENYVPKQRSKLAKVYVLLLDNDDKIIKLLENVLRALGFETIFTARDGYEGVKILREQSIDLVITDWDLQPIRQYPEGVSKDKVISTEWGDFPPNNGASFVHSLRHSPTSPHPFVPVIMITGPTLSNNIRYARDAGVNEILMKPVDARNLCRRIIEIVDNPRAFITSDNYKGPDRRRREAAWDKEERRKLEVKVIKYDG